MSVYQKDIKRILKQLMLVYETRTVYDNSRKLERFSAIELTLLEFIKVHKEVTQNDLLEIMDFKRTKLLGIIKKMIKNDYLLKVDNPRDKRSNFLTLGQRGSSILENYGEHEAIFLNFVLKDMTINEEKTIVKFLSKIQQTNYMK